MKVIDTGCILRGIGIEHKNDKNTHRDELITVRNGSIWQIFFCHLYLYFHPYGMSNQTKQYTLSKWLSPKTELPTYSSISLKKNTLWNLEIAIYKMYLKKNVISGHIGNPECHFGLSMVGHFTLNRLILEELLQLQIMLI